MSLLSVLSGSSARKRPVQPFLTLGQIEKTAKNHDRTLQMRGFIDPKSDFPAPFPKFNNEAAGRLATLC
jgi:hypothetical protein